MSGATIVVVLLVAAGIGLVWSWSAGARAGRAVANTMHQAGRAGGIAGRSLAIAVAVVTVQWVVMRMTTDVVAIAAVLGIPAVLSGITVARLLAGPADVLRVSRGSIR
ncbi:hypothetical protein [Pseudonocardia sp. N23]|uniref:hypothetical protein n=1 Tax=Pseudonocardia sp. N23 TaxID=1987376 RepID=UPI000BFBB72F|nr:hypothetical protein [Pseudonocardia sp. N23]GAY12439.1 hypothetical protein TOK_0835 [Pseudonocardia sp. N23]